MENNVVLSSKDIFSFAFASAKKHFWSFFIVIICFFAIELLSPNNPNSSFQFLRSLIAIVASIYLSVSVLNASLEIVNGQDVKLKNFFTWPKNGYKMIWAGLVAGLCLFPAFILVFFLSLLLSHIWLVIILGSILGISLAYLSVRLMFSKYRALDVGAGAIESIKYSFKITKGKFWRLIVLGLIMVGIYILGTIALVIGLLWAIPTVIIAQVLIYKTLSGGVNNSVNIVNNLPEIQPVELSANMSVAANSPTAQN